MPMSYGWCEPHNTTHPHLCAYARQLTMRELVEDDPYLQGPEVQTYDYAIPQGWVDDVKAKTGEYPEGFVWMYKPESIWGEPYGVTQRAKDLLERYNKINNPA